MNPLGSAVTYASYLGGNNVELIGGITVDGSGNTYLTGQTFSNNFPTVNPIQPTFGGGNPCCSGDAFITKVNPEGSVLVYSTYLGGSGGDFGHGIVLDDFSNVFLTGTTESPNFPTANPLQSAIRGFRDAFVVKVNANGSALIYSTYLGGHESDKEEGLGIAVDAWGNVYVTGTTNADDFPTVNPLQPAISGICEESLFCLDAFVTKLNTIGSALIYSTYLGGTRFDIGNKVAIDASGNAYILGKTGSLDFPTLKPLQQFIGGGPDMFIAKINDQLPNQPPAVVADNSSVTVNEGQTANNAGTISDPDGDAVTLTSSVGTITNNNDGTWSWSFTTSDGPAQSQIVTITADDGNVGIAQTSFALTVNNVAPSVSAVTVPVSPINFSSQPVSVSASFNDPAGTNDEPYICTIDFGDGSGPQAGTISGMTCSGNHTYAGAGVYVVTVTVTDKDNASGSASATNFVVIYDPSAGFVTGGGWINSPPGAYVPNPTLIGKANFGFVSKYQKGKSIPDGNTTFHFNTANFKFKSTSYEWLVIAGPKAQYKGDGTVNNSGNYGFLLFARDGQVNGGGGVDKFRIKIWDKNNGDAVVYDNQMGDPDNGDATDAIEGGSIEIHSSSAKAVAGSSDEEIASVPAEYALEQNYPNPFNPETEIRFQLPQDSHVVLKVFNTSGREILTLTDGQYQAGYHRIRWDGKDENGNLFASGVYLYQLKTGGFSEARKMILLR